MLESISPGRGGLCSGDGYVRSRTRRKRKACCISIGRQRKERFLRTHGRSGTGCRNGWGVLFYRKQPVWMRWMRYAAVVAWLVTAVGGTYWATRKWTLQQSAEMCEMFVPYGDASAFVLPDSSRVWVNAGSTLLYPTNFKQLNSRTVYLTGEASFFVSKDKEKPFIVKTSGLDVQALGTVFTVKSYAWEDCILATLEEGSVKVSVGNNSGQSYVLKPGEQLVYSHADNSVRIHQVDLSSFRMTRKGYLVFENATFEEMIRTLERKYGVIFQCNVTRYGAGLYNVKFAPDEDIREVMEILRQLIGIKYIIKDYASALCRSKDCFVAFI